MTQTYLRCILTVDSHSRMRQRQYISQYRARPSGSASVTSLQPRATRHMPTLSRNLRAEKG